MGNVKEFTYTLSFSPSTNSVISETISVKEAYDGIPLSQKEEETLFKEIFVLRKGMYDKLEKWMGVKPNEETTPVTSNQLRTLSNFKNEKKTRFLVEELNLTKLSHSEASEIIQKGIEIMRTPEEPP